MPLNLIFAPIFAAADRIAGGDYIAHIQAWAALHLPKWALTIINIRSTVWVWLALMIVAALVNPKLCALATAWALWRLPGWGFLFGGKIDPRTAGEVARYFGRQCFALVAVPALWWLGAPLWLAVAALVAFALAAALLGRLLALAADRWRYDANAWVELARGLAYGLAVAASMPAG